MGQWFLSTCIYGMHGGREGQLSCFSLANVSLVPFIHKQLLTSFSGRIPEMQVGTS